MVLQEAQLLHKMFFFVYHHPCSSNSGQKCIQNGSLKNWPVHKMVCLGISNSLSQLLLKNEGFTKKQTTWLIVKSVHIIQQTIPNSKNSQL